MRCFWGAHICLLSRYRLVYFLFLGFSSVLINFVYLKCDFVLINKSFCILIYFHILNQMALCVSDLTDVLLEVSAYGSLPVIQCFLTFSA